MPAWLGEVTPATEMTITGPTTNHEFASTARSRTKRTSPRTASGSLASAQAAGTARVTSAGGRLKSSGTNAGCVGTVPPAPVSNSVRDATMKAITQAAAPSTSTVPTAGGQTTRIANAAST